MKSQKTKLDTYICRVYSFYVDKNGTIHDYIKNDIFSIIYKKALKQNRIKI